MKFVSMLGSMQGRLSPMIDNQIQSFPFKEWKKEFSQAKKLGLKFIEWTLDYKNIFLNPIFKAKEIKKIKEIF
jgi:hypothetical protein